MDHPKAAPLLMCWSLSGRVRWFRAGIVRVLDLVAGLARCGPVHLPVYAAAFRLGDEKPLDPTVNCPILAVTGHPTGPEDCGPAHLCLQRRRWPRRSRS